MTCLYCDIVAGSAPHHEVVWENDSHMAFLTVRPEQPGHVLVIPKKHAEYVFGMSREEYASLMEVCRVLAGPLQEVLGAKRIAVAISGFEIPHVHVHLVPANGHGALCNVQDYTWREDAQVLRVMAEKLRPVFKTISV
jgi:histidine triad (HIT) family protein